MNNYLLVCIFMKNAFLTKDSFISLFIAADSKTK